jgi:hypothetical protein
VLWLSLLQSVQEDYEEDRIMELVRIRGGMNRLRIMFMVACAVSVVESWSVATTVLIP